MAGGGGDVVAIVVAVAVGTEYSGDLLGEHEQDEMR